MAADSPSRDTIFCTAIEIASAEDRVAYIARECGDDAALRAEVHKLVAAHFRAGSFLEGPAHDPPAIGADEAASPETSGTEQPGVVLGGRYKLLEPIGEGGMGTVWMAQQTTPVKRLVAVKLIKTGMDSKAVLARFEAERQAVALMDHPNIAKVLDAGTTEPGRPYFVMELVKGVPITKYCDEQRLTLRQRLELFVPVCQAVQHAHQKGIIHRDIKPNNVLVACYDDLPVPKVIDFGVAKATEQQLTEQTLHTGFGTVVGTVEYMSPEQASFNQLDVDTRSDVYALGVLLYELLTGTTPLERKRLKEAAFLELLRLVREEEPPRPSTRLSTTETLPSIAANRGTEPKRLSGLVRGELDWIVMKALEKDRSRRYETANGFAMDVQRYLADEPVQACPPSSWYRFRKFARRHKAALVMGSVIVLALFVAVAGIAGGVGWAARERATRQVRLIEQVGFHLAEVERLQKDEKWPEALAMAKRAEAALAGGEAEPATKARVAQVLADLELVRRLEDIRLDMSQWKGKQFDYAGSDQKYASAFREAGIDVERLSAREAAQRIQSRPGVTVALVVALDNWADVRGRTPGLPKHGVGQRALTEVAQVVDVDPWRRRVREALVRGDRKALQDLAASAEVFRQHPSTLLQLGGKLGVNEDGLAVLRKAQQTYPGDFWINFQLANYYFNYYGEMKPLQLDEAVSFGRVAVGLRPQSDAAYYNLGCALQAQKKLDEAVAAYRKAIALKPDVQHRAYLNLGIALRAQKKLDEAVAAYEKAIALRPDFALAHNNLGTVLAEQKKLSEAVAAFCKAIDLKQDFAEAYNNLGNALRDQKKLDAAVAAYKKAIQFKQDYHEAYYSLGNALKTQKKLDAAVAAFRRAIDCKHDYAEAYHQLGIALAEQKKLDEAITAFKKAIQLKPNYASAYSNLGCALRNQKKLDEAITAFKKAITLQPDYAFAYANLGLALRDQKKLDEAATAFRKADQLLPNHSRIRDELRLTERWLELDKQLPAILAGKAKPSSPQEQVELALFCAAYKDCPRAAVGFFADAFTAEPKLANNLQAAHRYNAACAAALAFAGKGADAAKLDDKERGRLRQQALDWLRADLAAYTRLAEKDNPNTRQAVPQRLAHWQQDADLAPLRDEKALAALPEKERAAWQKLWAEVGALRKKTQKKD